MEVTLNRRRIITLLAAATLSLIVLSVASQVYQVMSGRERYLVDMVNLDREHNIPTLFQTLSVYGISLILLWIGQSEKGADKARGRHWKVMSFAMFIAATDDILAIHEAFISPIKRLLKTGGYLHFAWVIPGALTVLILAAYFYRFFNTLPKRTRLLFYISAGVYLLGAVGLEMVGGKLATSVGKGAVSYIVTTQIEEILEMTGVLIFEYAILGYLKSNPLSVSVKVT
jgi:hypothetical protein